MSQEFDSNHTYIYIYRDTYISEDGMLSRKDKGSITQGPLLLTWFNSNPSMDKLSHA